MHSKIKFCYLTFELGANYIIRTAAGKASVCRLIKTTQKGYNFLNLRTQTCVFKKEAHDVSKAKIAGRPRLAVPRSLTFEKTDNYKAGDSVIYAGSFIGVVQYDHTVKLRSSGKTINSLYDQPHKFVKLKR